MEIEKILANLKRRGFDGQYFETAGEAADYIEDSVKNCSVGMSGSVTLDQMGIYERLIKNNDVHWHWKDGKEGKKASSCTDVYLTSVNAMSSDGEIVNIAGSGNRVASMTYGHSRLIIVLGKNKLTDTLDQAIWRARNVAAPLNAIRLGRKTPCAMLEPHLCHDCSGPERLCAAIEVFMWKTMSAMAQQVEVLIIGEELGY